MERTSKQREFCIANSVKMQEYARKFPRGRWSFLGPACEEKWYGTHTQKPDGEWDRTAESMMLNFAESGHPAFRATGASERGELRGKGKGKKSIHLNGSEETVDLILRTVVSVNQLCIYGAVADLCRASAKDSPSTREHAESENWESLVVPTKVSNANDISKTDMSVQGNLLRGNEQKFAKLPEDRKLTNLCSDAGFLKDVGRGKFFITLEEEGSDDMQKIC